MSQKKLIWQLYPSYLVVTLVAVVAVAIYCSGYFRQVYHTQVRDALDQLARVAAEQVRAVLQTEGPSSLDGLCKRLGSNSQGRTRLTIIAPSGKVLGDSDEDPAMMEDHSGRPEIREALWAASGSSVRFSPTLGTQMMYVAVALREQGAPVAVVRAAAPLTEIDSAIKSDSKSPDWQIADTW